MPDIAAANPLTQAQTASVILELTPRQVADLRRDDPTAVLLDCRLPQEHAIARLGGAVLVPMHEMPDHLESLRQYAGRRIVVYCHRGVRSRQAAAWLRERGFAGACSMAGGIERWSIDIDPTVPRY